MAQRDPTEIPQELIDQVIDLCSADKKTLKACSLISRAWVHRTRKYLFSTLKLTSDSLITWCEDIVTPTPDIQQSLPHTTSRPPALSPYVSSWPSSFVTSLCLVAVHSPASNNIETVILRTDAHLSAFINLKTLTLSLASLTDFQEASLRTCFGPLAKTVRELNFSSCSLDRSFFTFLKVFTHLESLELDGSVWDHNSLAGSPHRVLPQDLPTLRGSFAALGFANPDTQFFDLLANVRLEYHTITIAYGAITEFRPFNTLFAKCKDHLRMLTFTNSVDVATSRRGSGFDLSTCKELVEIHARLDYGLLGLIIATLKTVLSRKFRKLTVDIALPKIKPEDWAEFDKEIFVLAKRVCATAGNDALEVLIRRRMPPGGTQLSEIERVLPLVSLSGRVSLRTCTSWESLRPLGRVSF